MGSVGNTLFKFLNSPLKALCASLEERWMFHGLGAHEMASEIVVSSGSSQRGPLSSAPPFTKYHN